MVSIAESAKLKARTLASVYGHALERSVVYTQGVALTARLQLAKLDPNIRTRDPKSRR